LSCASPGSAALRAYLGVAARVWWPIDREPHPTVPRALRLAVLLFAGIALCRPLTGLSAQDTVLTPGMRLRVTNEHRLPQIETGMYRDLTDTTLVLSHDTLLVMLPLAGISRLERSQGRKPGIASGVAGLLLGAAAGGFIACTANRDAYGVLCGGQNDTRLVIGAALGGAAGAALGALLFRRERWTDVELRRH
jgi:hypothetical protein